MPRTLPEAWPRPPRCLPPLRRIGEERCQIGSALSLDTGGDTSTAACEQTVCFWFAGTLAGLRQGQGVHTVPALNEQLQTHNLVPDGPDIRSKKETVV